MKRLHIGGSSLLTGDALADAVLDYASALARSGGVEVVDLPIVDESGEPHDARIVLTPTTVIWSRTITAIEGEEDPVDDDLVRFLRERAPHGVGALERDPARADGVEHPEGSRPLEHDSAGYELVDPYNL